MGDRLCPPYYYYPPPPGFSDLPTALWCIWEWNMEIRQKTDRSLQFFIHMFPFAFRNGWFLHVRWQKACPCLIILILPWFYLGNLRIKVWIKFGYFLYIFMAILFWLYIIFCLNYYVWIKLGHGRVKSKFQKFHNLCLQVFSKGNPNHEIFVFCDSSSDLLLFTIRSWFFFVYIYQKSSLNFLWNSMFSFANQISFSR